MDGVSLTVQPGEFVCLIGPSGCGKTTTLKLINRLLEPDQGTVYIDGKDVRQMDPVSLRRQIGYVIQQIGLLPHLTVEENIALVPKLLGWDKDRRKQRVWELLQMVGMDPGTFAHRYPKELSGGQQQRVGVLRALAAEPPLVLMDEPFGALDPITRQTLQQELRRIHAQLHKTILFVTHDIAEALLLADRIVVMKDGKIRQLATPQELIANPADEFVAEFVGHHRLNGGPGSRPYKAQDALAPLPVAAADTPVQELRALLLHAPSVLITDAEGKLLGMVNKESLNAPEAKAADVAQPAPMVVNAATPLADILDKLVNPAALPVPVVGQDGRLVGAITRETLLRTLFGAGSDQT